jgi:hypothetical protein
VARPTRVAVGSGRKPTEIDDETYSPRHARGRDGPRRRLTRGGHGAAPVSFSFLATGTHEQSYLVPAGVHQIRVAAVGAAGGTKGICGGGAPGRGASLAADLPVSPGTTLFVEVGGAGANGCGGVSVAAGGFNGGGNSGTSAGNEPGGGGGGASDVRTASIAGNTQQSLASRLIVAGAGGGAAPNFGAANGGDAGSAGTGANGAAGGGPGVTTTFGGGSGGAGGVPNGCAGASNGLAGALGAGGAGGSSAAGAGGGGGGGYYGGGGGTGDVASPTCGGGGGGGGSSYVSATATDVTDPTPTASAAGVTITPLVPEATPDVSAVSFPTQPQGTLSAPKPIQITNTGTATLHVGDAVTSGTNSDDFVVSGCQSPLAPGDACVLQVRFAPQGQNARRPACRS